MRRALVLAVFFLASCGEPSAGLESPTTVPSSQQAEPQALVTVSESDDDARSVWPQMTVQLVTSHSPEELLSLWTYLDLSEAGQDGFYEAYANALSPETDRKFALAARIRSQIFDAFGAVCDIQRLATGLGGFGHEYARLSGKVEHILYSGFQSKFAASAKIQCKLTDVEKTLSEIESQFDPHDWDDAGRQLASIKQARSRFMAALNHAEAQLDEHGKQYFRSQLLDYMRAWLRMKFP